MVCSRSHAAVPAKALRFLLILLLLILAGCRAAPRPVAQRVDDTPRLAIVSAFEPELSQIRKQAAISGSYDINGRTFWTGTLEGRPVLLFLSGVSMVNAALNIQAAIDHFHLTGIVFTGIAGGANPDLRIGDVVIPAEWAEYQEQVFARQTEKGWDTGFYPSKYGSYGMMFPQPVGVTRKGAKSLDAEEQKFWFAVDPAMLAAARQAAGQAQLKRCPKMGPCLQQTPRVVVGGRGVSGPTFVDNASYREWVWQNFHADALDMESAAAAHVAYTNQVPFLAFRSLSDLAGGGPGQNEMLTFLQLAAENSANTVIAFMKNFPVNK